MELPPYFDFATGAWKLEEPVDEFNVEQLELAHRLDQENLTLGGEGGTKLQCEACKIPAEYLFVKLQPETIWCTSCRVQGMAEVVLADAGAYAKEQYIRNLALAQDLGTHRPDIFNSIENDLRRGVGPLVPFFIYA